MRGFLCALFAFSPGRSFVELFLELLDFEAEFNPPKTGAFVGVGRDVAVAV
jgi:hypothetical protein